MVRRQWHPEYRATDPSMDLLSKFPWRPSQTWHRLVVQNTLGVYSTPRRAWPMGAQEQDQQVVSGTPKLKAQALRAGCPKLVVLGTTSWPRRLCECVYVCVGVYFSHCASGLNPRPHCHRPAPGQWLRRLAAKGQFAIFSTRRPHANGGGLQASLARRGEASEACRARGRARRSSATRMYWSWRGRGGRN